MDELKLTKERVLEAAGSCSTAKQVLEKLFPEAFMGQPLVRSGTRLLRTNFNGKPEEYIVASTAVNVTALISLSKGNRWTDPVPVNSWCVDVPLVSLIGRFSDVKDWTIK